MTVSDVTEYENTGLQIVNKAFAHIRVTQKGQALEEDDQAFGLDSLNSIVKSWQRDGLHLWKDREAALFLELGRRTYKLGNQTDRACPTECIEESTVTNRVHATNDDWVPTETTAAITAGSNAVSIASLIAYSGTTFSLDCVAQIGIKNVSGNLEWFKVLTNVGLDLTLTGNLSEDVDEGAAVYIYRYELDKPLRVYPENIRLWQGSNYELPLYLLAWTDYNLLPVKNETGTVVQAFYQPEINRGEMAIWPTSNTVDNVLVFRYQSPLNIFETGVNTQDFPSEWIRSLEWALAAELGPAYGVPLPRQQQLDSRAATLKNEVGDWDQDNSSLYIYPRMWGQV